MIELVKQIANLQKQVDGLIKPEKALGLSLITDTVLSADAASVVFSSVPQGFRHLLLMIHARSAVVAETDLIRVRFNADATAIYDVEAIVANAATLTSAGTRADSSIPTFRCEGASSRSNSFSPGIGWVFQI